MAWNIEFSPKARKDLGKIGASEAKRILKFLYERVRLAEDPRAMGKALVGPRLGGLWRYRVGDYCSKIGCQTTFNKNSIYTKRFTDPDWEGRWAHLAGIHLTVVVQT